MKETIEDSSPNKSIRFSFVTIVLNGMPFIEYALKSVYDEAHEIIIVEGSVEKCRFAANKDGSSTDGTVECIKNFFDPEKKIRLIQGDWPEKLEMQNEGLKHVTGDYVWLMDSDEIYSFDALKKARLLVESDPDITQVNFIPNNFWKGFDYIFVSNEFFEESYHYRRLFKNKEGAVFSTHRPPTLIYPDRNCSSEEIKCIGGEITRKMGIIPFHYSYVYNTQVKQKIELYRRYGWGKDWNIDLVEWYQNGFLKWKPENRIQTEKYYAPWTGNPESRTCRYDGNHPEVMLDYIEKYREEHDE
ncbi:glycosyltransferase family 2 protein [uncultured Desulfobacter sp.]|uniref:glycosyltransferase family 2 protein n=1 Tax=uncultured Desulfobacter sp. TaxID=240139 RepID=UPI002AAAEDA2|nr:glycosyltransferase family 2 protein [uncultured Desulfobacter sp.]